MSALTEPIEATPFTQAGDPANNSQLTTTDVSQQPGKKRRGRPLGSKNKKKKLEVPETILDLPKETVEDNTPVQVQVQNQPSATANVGAQPMTTAPLVAGEKKVAVHIDQEEGKVDNYDTEKTTDITDDQKKEAAGQAESNIAAIDNKDFIDVNGYNLGTQKTVFGRIFNTPVPLLRQLNTAVLSDQNALGNPGWVKQQRLNSHLDQMGFYTTQNTPLKNPPLYTYYGGQP